MKKKFIVWKQPSEDYPIWPLDVTDYGEKTVIEIKTKGASESPDDPSALGPPAFYAWLKVNKQCCLALCLAILGMLLAIVAIIQNYNHK